MKAFLAFIFAWWDTPLYMWSIKVLVGMICMVAVPILPFAIIAVIFDEIDQLRKKKK